MKKWHLNFEFYHKTEFWTKWNENKADTHQGEIAVEQKEAELAKVVLEQTPKDRDIVNTDTKATFFFKSKTYLQLNIT